MNDWREKAKRIANEECNCCGSIVSPCRHVCMAKALAALEQAEKAVQTSLNEQTGSAMTLIEALTKIPPGFHLEIARERDPEDGHEFLTAVLMEEPPEDGWPSLAAYFGHEGGPTHADDAQRLSLYAHDDAARVGISTPPEDPVSFERLLIDMIDRQNAKQKK